MDRKQKSAAFTLAELLIALTILGLIATFTIPKVLQAHRNTAWNAAFKETAASIAEAYSTYKLKNKVDANFNASLLTPYLNYVRTDNTTTLDGDPGAGAWECSWDSCLKLHNGGYLLYQGPWMTFGGTTPTNCIRFLFDPDGRRSGDDPEHASIRFYLRYDGRIVDGVNAGGEVFFQGGSPEYTYSHSAPSWFNRNWQ